MNIKEDIRLISDKKLVFKIVRTSESRLFAELYDRYATRVYNTCIGFASSKEEAQDLTHDLFLKLFIKLGTYEGRSKFSTWLYSFVYNFCVNHVNRNKQIRNKKLNEAIVKEVVAGEFGLSEAELYELKCERLTRALARLEPQDKAILLMKYQDDFPIRAIQEALEISQSAVKMRLKRARERLLLFYENKSYHDEYF